MITILMASYNGERYIGEQIESILNQTETNWKLVIQDDCSSDATYQIACRYAAKYPEKIAVFRRAENSGSAANNFFSMLTYADGDYVMFCDDDDVWLPNKIEKSMEMMRKEEQKNGIDKPVLVHSDLVVVDENLNILSRSMFQRQNLDAKRCRLHNILVQNIVTGCTMAVNRSLIRMVTKTEMPEKAIMHDWWFALIASAFGTIAFVDTPTVLYRQHGKNAVGAKNANSIAYNFKRLMQSTQAKNVLNNTYLQAQEFMERFSLMLDATSLNLVKDFTAIPQLTKMQKIKMLYRRNFWKSGFYRKCGQILFI
ncbi:MAG: Putative glycosyltransferase EpsE [Eubacteriales bacterium]|jgi:glycosyltransferase involved in cell wall biosynthesis